VPCGGYLGDETPEPVESDELPPEGVVEALEELRAELAADKIEFVIARAKSQVIDRLDRFGFSARIGARNFYPSVRTAAVPPSLT